MGVDTNHGVDIYMYRGVCALWGVVIDREIIHVIMTASLLT